MAARPPHHPAHDLIHLLLAAPDLDPLLTALARRTASRLMAFGGYRCGLLLRRRNRAVLSGASCDGFADVVRERLGDGDDGPLAAALGRSALSYAHAAQNGWADDPDAGLLVVPVRAGETAQAALALVGERPDSRDSRRLLGAVGRLRNENSWALHLAVRYTDERDLAEHRAQAMQHRTVIDVAIGVIMAQSRCSADEAFDVLRRASNHRNVKLHAVAAELVQRIHPALPAAPFTA